MLYEGVDVSVGKRAKPKTIPSPVGGLNGRDARANMAPEDAYHMDNIMPGTGSCKLRKGVVIHAEPSEEPVTSLDVYSSGNTDEFFALTDGDWINVTNPLALATVKSGIVGDYTISTMFATVADHAQFLIMTTDGDDTPWRYNGTAAADLVFTGLNEAATKLDYVCSYMGRLFWATRDKLGFYYLPPGQIQGAMAWFDLGQIFKRGGHLDAISTYSEDAGDGPNEYIVFSSSNGEHAMYHGTDPGNAAAWDLVGRYRAAPVVGRKCTLDYAGDLILLTLEGALQFSQIRKLADTRYSAIALTSKLGDILASHNRNSTVPGWCMELYAKSGWFIVSVPNEANISGSYHHYVMNTTTQAWARVLGAEINALCWCVANGKLYYGRYDGSVRQAEVGYYDNGSAIEWLVKQAYNYYGSPDYKHFKWSIFRMQSEAPVIISSALSMDFKERVPVPVIGGLTVLGAEWDDAFWDAEYWASGTYVQYIVQPYGEYGVAASNWSAGAVGGASLEWFATQIVFEDAQGLLG